MSSSSSAPNSGAPVSVLFVCLGNICRSTMSEGVFQHLTHYNPSSSSSSEKKHPLIATIDSCGTGGYHIGAAPDSRTLAVLRSHGLTNYKHRARQVRVPQDFQEFDYLIAMDGSNYSDLQALARRAQKQGTLGPEAVDKVFLYGEFGGRDAREEIDDPYYGGKDGFETAYEQAERCGKGLLRHIEEKAKKAAAAEEGEKL